MKPQKFSSSIWKALFIFATGNLKCNISHFETLVADERYSQTAKNRAALSGVLDYHEDWGS